MSNAPGSSMSSGGQSNPSGDTTKPGASVPTTSSSGNGSSSGGNNSKAAAIAGGVIGGMAGVTIVVALCCYFGGFGTGESTVTGFSTGYGPSPFSGTPAARGYPAYVDPYGSNPVVVGRRYTSGYYNF
jgi:hypothetical protein